MLNALPRLGIQLPHCTQPHTLVLTKLTCAKAGFEHLIDLLQRPILDLWQEEEDPRRRDTARWEPYESVPWPPVHRLWVNKIRRRKRSKPSAYEPSTSRKTESVAPQALRGQFTAREPGVC
jgi:hypothetical protein